MKDYNFFEPYGRKKSSMKPGSTVFWMVLVLLVCAALAGLKIGDNYLISKEIAATNDAIVAYSADPYYEEALAVKKRIDDLNRYDYEAENILERMSSENVITSEFIEALSGEIPSTVILKDINVDNSTAVMGFQASNRKAVAETVLRLKESGLFTDVVFDTVISQEGSNIVDVVINATMKAGEGR